MRKLEDMDPVVLENGVIVYISGYDQKDTLYGKIAYILSSEGNKIIQNRKYIKYPFPLGDSKWGNFKENIEEQFPDFICGFDLDPHVVSFRKEIVKCSPDPFEVFSIMENNPKISEIFDLLDNRKRFKLGIIGSILLGSRTYGDLDILVYGKDKLDELSESLEHCPGVRRMLKEELLQKQLHEYKTIFPNISERTIAKMINNRSQSRFFINNTEISLWARYDRTLRTCFYETPHDVSQERVQTRIRVSDDTFTEYFPVVLKDEKNLDRILMFNRFFRGAFRNGDELFLDGKKATFYTDKEDLEFIVIDYESFIELEN